MESFTYFARYLLRYRAQMTLSMSCAVLSATVFGVAVGMAQAAFRVVFRKEMGLHAYLERHNTGIKGWLIPDFLVNIAPTEKEYMTGVVWLVGFIVALTILSAVLRMIQNYTAATICIRASCDIRMDLFHRLISLPLLTLIAQPVTERVSRIMRDSHQLIKGYSNLLGRSMGDLLAGIAALIVAMVTEPIICLVALVLAPILGWYYKRHGRLVRRAGRVVLGAWSNMLGAIVESLQGMRVVKVHHAETFEVDRFGRVNQRYEDAEYPLRWCKSVASPTIQIIIMVAFFVVALVAAYRIDQGMTDAPKVFTALMALLLVAQRLRPLTMVYTEVAESAAAGDRLLEVLTWEMEDPDESGKTELPRLQRSVEFDGVRFSYPDAESPALDGISLQIDAGQTVAFVGPNGCGKTTLLSLVPRLFDPQEGAVRIDGVDLRRVTLASLRRQVAVVTQETVLFNDTVAKNIAYGIDEPSRDRIEGAARSAFADSFIREKPQGYETEVGERGQALSGGERQRVAIARAILRDPAILILDEATSMIDAETEAMITEALATFCKGRTSLVIAHRLSTVVDADQIVVMNHGRVVDRGTHAELMQRCELYQQLCRTQLVSEDDGAPSNGQITGRKPTNEENAAAVAARAVARDAMERDEDTVDEFVDEF